MTKQDKNKVVLIIVGVVLLLLVIAYFLFSPSETTNIDVPQVTTTPTLTPEITTSAENNEGTLRLYTEGNINYVESFDEDINAMPEENREEEIRNELNLAEDEEIVISIPGAASPRFYDESEAEPALEEEPGVNPYYGE